jgi:hypothetical protein
MSRNQHSGTSIAGASLAGFAAVAFTILMLLLVLPLISSAAPAQTSPTSTTPAPTTPTSTTPTPAPPAAKPPLAYTGYALETTETTATLRGSVNPRGEETSYSFEYGTDASYGSQTVALPVGTGAQEVKVSQALAGLRPATSYHFRIVATNATGTAFGPDHLFTTKKTPLRIAIIATPNPSLFGAHFRVNGTVSGTDAGNQSVAVQESTFPYLGGFSALGLPEITDPLGAFSIPIDGLSKSAQLRVVTVDQPRVFSPVITELVAVKVSFHMHHTARRGYMHLYGSVAPAQAGARVDFQWLRHGHRPAIISSSVLPSGSSRFSSRFSATVRIRHRGLYRAYVRVSSGDLISHYSHAIRIR